MLKFQILKEVYVKIPIYVYIFLKVVREIE